MAGTPSPHGRLARSPPKPFRMAIRQLTRLEWVLKMAASPQLPRPTAVERNEVSMNSVFGFDAYSPKEVAERVESIGVTKARLPLLTMTVLGVLAGGFIGLGALYFTLVASDRMPA